MRDFGSSSNVALCKFLEVQVGNSRQLLVRPDLWEAALGRRDGLSVPRTLDRGASRCAAAYVDEESSVWSSEMHDVMDKHFEAAGVGLAPAPALIVQGIVLSLLGDLPDIARKVIYGTVDTDFRQGNEVFDAMVVAILGGLLCGNERVVRDAATLLHMA